MCGLNHILMMAGHSGETGIEEGWEAIKMKVLVTPSSWEDTTHETTLAEALRPESTIDRDGASGTMKPA
jgi:hypothetical protein